MSISPISRPQQAKYHEEKTQSPAWWKTALCALLLFGLPIREFVNNYYAVQLSPMCPLLQSPIAQPPFTCPLTFGYPAPIDLPDPLDMKNAIAAQDIEGVKMVIESGIDLEKLGYFKFPGLLRESDFSTEPIHGEIGYHTPLGYAIRMAIYAKSEEEFTACRSIVELLLQGGASVDTPSWNPIIDHAEPIFQQLYVWFLPKRDENLLLLLLEYATPPPDLLTRAILDRNYEFAGKMLAMDKKPTLPLFKKGTYPFVEPLEGWIEMIKDFGIRVIIEEESMSFQSIPKNQLPEPETREEELRRAAKHLDLGRWISQSHFE